MRSEIACIRSRIVYVGLREILMNKVTLQIGGYDFRFRTSEFAYYRFQLILSRSFG